ncbi:DinB family protein [Pseudalkalibacillus sp. A8]|uniref:DinB family protein n=1 Tax=Pseudalkalibacillus sp. A8 TaxID=3382641 RepID=UPI0038B4A701
MKLQVVLIDEFKNELEMTRNVLKRIPEDKLTWCPHPKSMSVGQLGLHTAVIPGKLAELFSELERAIPTVPLPEPASLDEILLALEKSKRVGMDHLSQWGEEDLEAEWRMTDGKNTLMAAPRLAMVRSLMLNHWYHHRGQLTVYLRLLDVPVPAVYGPSADEN